MIRLATRSKEARPRLWRVCCKKQKPQNYLFSKQLKKNGIYNRDVLSTYLLPP